LASGTWPTNAGVFDVIVVSCQVTPVNPVTGGADGDGAELGAAVGVGNGVAVGALEAAELEAAVGVAVGAGVADGDGDGVGEGEDEADAEGLAEAASDADAEGETTGVDPGTPATNVIVAPSARESVSWPPETDQVVAVVIAWANRGPKESSGHIAMVEMPGLIVMPSEPLVVYEPEIWLQSAFPL
jgi:hypothetical protein